MCRLSKLIFCILCALLTQQINAQWHKINFSNHNAEYLTSVIKYKNTIYTGDFAKGVLYSNDNCKTWSKRDYKIPFYSANKAAFNNGGDLFIISESSLVMLTSVQSFSPEIKNTSIESGSEYYLSPSYPNPFNSASTIKYYIPTTSYVSIKIFNALGQELETLVDEEKSVGTYELNWNAVKLPSGVYFYRLQAGSFVQTRKMILLK